MRRIVRRLAAATVANIAGMDALPPAVEGTVLRVLATTDLGATFVPVPASFGTHGTCAGVVWLLELERKRQPTVWLDAGDLVVGPVGVLLGRRPWGEMAQLPIAAAAAGNHEFDDGVPALLKAARSCRIRCCAPTSTSGCPAPQWWTPTGVRLG
jgi:2',3'-cyclic-nucleotide 2'-phosphodiesterase (5'-nucleotidase family)